MELKRQSRRGNAIVFGVSLLALAGMNALVVDVGTARVGVAEMQTRVEAGALAGVAFLDGMDTGLVAARLAAVTVANMNDVTAVDTQVSAEDIEFGLITADGVFEPSQDATVIDAIRILGVDRTGPMFFSGIFDLQMMGMGAGGGPLTVAATGIAQQPPPGGAGVVACPLPLIIPDCFITDTDPEDAEALELKMSSSNNDNAAWGVPSGIGLGANASDITQMIGGGCPEMTEVDMVALLNNGQIQVAFKDLVDAFGTSDSMWDATRFGPQPAQDVDSKLTVDKGQTQFDYYGKVIEGPIMTIATDPNVPCGSAEQFNGEREITGFTYAAVYDVFDPQGKGQASIKMKLDVTTQYDFGEGGGGLDGTNVTYTPPPTLVY